MSDAVKGDRYRLPDGREKVKAHDIRHLCICGICGGIADQRASISANAAYRYGPGSPARSEPDAFWHPACCYEDKGEKFVLDLPGSEQAKFCLSDAPVSVIKQLVELMND